MHHTATDGHGPVDTIVTNDLGTVSTCACACGIVVSADTAPVQ